MNRYYVVTFDLNCEDKDDFYNKVEEYLRTFPLFAKPTKNVYLVGGADCQSFKIKEDLKKIFKEQCIVLVAELKGDYSSYNYTQINEELRNFFK